jgi:hypothetical protein
MNVKKLMLGQCHCGGVFIVRCGFMRMFFGFLLVAGGKQESEKGKSKFENSFHGFILAKVAIAPCGRLFSTSDLNL